MSDAIHLSFPCPHCKKVTVKELSELISRDNTTCGRCGGVIDLKDKVLSSAIAKAQQKAT